MRYIPLWTCIIVGPRHQLLTKGVRKLLFIVRDQKDEHELDRRKRNTRLRLLATRCGNCDNAMCCNGKGKRARVGCCITPEVWKIPVPTAKECGDYAPAGL